MRNGRLAAGLGLMFLALGTSGVARAALLVDNGAPSTLNPGGSNLSDTQQAQDFQLTVLSSLTGIRFWTVQLTNADYLNNILWEIHGDNAGVPSATVFASGLSAPTRTALAPVTIGASSFMQFQNDLAITANNLVAGNYWLTLHNGAITSIDFTDYYWSAADPNSSVYLGVERALNPLTDWTVNEQELSFQIYGTALGAVTAPEPGTWGLAGIALLLVGLARKKIK